MVAWVKVWLAHALSFNPDLARGSVPRAGLSGSHAGSNSIADPDGEDEVASS